MPQANKKETKKVDTKEFELPETVFVRDIENKVFQEIVLQCLEKIPGVTPVEGSFMENIFGRSSAESLKGIYTEQDSRNQSISVRVDVNISYGLTIPEKAEEIQTLISEEITRITGLHVSAVHVVFKGITSLHSMRRGSREGQPLHSETNIEEEYSDEF